MTPTSYMPSSPLPPLLWKNNPPERGGEAPPGPYGDSPYKEPGGGDAAQDRGWHHADPPVHYGIGRATWASSWRGGGRCRERGDRAHPVHPNGPRYAIVRSNEKSADDGGSGEVGGFVSFSRPGGCQRAGSSCSWFLGISSGKERDSSLVAEIQSSFGR